MNKSEHHSQICDRLNAIYYAKNQDYGDSFGKAYAEYGDISAMVRISDKFNRLKQLTNGHEPQVDEPLKDTILDMANYLIMWAMELEEKP